MTNQNIRFEENIQNESTEMYSGFHGSNRDIEN